MTKRRFHNAPFKRQELDIELLKGALNLSAPTARFPFAHKRRFRARDKPDVKCVYLLTDTPLAFVGEMGKYNGDHGSRVERQKASEPIR